jgi:hypothetical protein
MTVQKRQQQSRAERWAARLDWHIAQDRWRAARQHRRQQMEQRRAEDAA